MPFPDDLDDIFEAFVPALGAGRELNGPSTIYKPRGRQKGWLGPKARAIREAVQGLVPQFDRMTVRQVFYALTVAGVVPKEETSGYRPVQQQLTKMRREGVLPWAFIADGTRLMRMQSQWDSADDFIEDVRRSYRRNLWQSQGVRIEVWLEKDALAEVIFPVTGKWRVPLMVSRGQSSVTFLHSAAMAAKDVYGREGTATYVYALYDYDSGGERASRTIERDLAEFAGEDVPIYFERLAVTPAQIAAWGLPTRPPKSKDPEAKAWAAKSLAEIGQVGAVELDAIPPNQLTKLVEDAIITHVDEDQWAIERTIEAEERKGLLSLRLPS
jgi:hypothetical protein